MKLALDIIGVSEALSVRPETVREWERDGAMPKPVKLPDGSRRWRVSDVRQWIDGKYQEPSR